jgi:3-dehydrosphinganine reductase
MAKQSQLQKQPLRDKTAVVCGGSKGIGKETAKEIVRLGGSVCLIARHQDALEAAAREIEAPARADSQFVDRIACDTTDMQNLKSCLVEFIGRRGVPDFLINAVGYSYPQYVQDLRLEDFRQLMDVNYYGQLVPILILLPYFIQAQKGHIANVSSMMGYFGIMGFAAYAPTKFAIVGLTEALRHELKPYHIDFSVLYPPDTDTPGFETENRTKPPECAMLSQDAGLLKPEQVAQAFVKGILKKKFAILPGEAGLIWRAFRLFPWLVRWVADNQYKRARRKLGKESMN